MPEDIRIKTTMPNHIKTKKLIRKLGYQGFFCLIALWCYAGANKPKGVLDGMNEEDISIAAIWDKEPEVFIKALLECDYLEKIQDGIFTLHDWDKHNSWSYYSEERSKIAKKAAKIRWKNKQCGTDAERMRGASKAHTKGNPPSPSPFPSPSPLKKENTLSSNGARPHIPYEEIIADLNTITGKRFSFTAKATQRLIRARFDEGRTLEDFKKVHRNKAAWKDDPKFCAYLRPETLYAASHFESYLNEDNPDPEAWRYE